MATILPNPARNLHPFGGCNKIVHQYRSIGLELLRFERDTRGINVGFNIEKAQDAFRIGVSFVPLEILESYLDDLLDNSVKEDRLFLRRGAIRFTPSQLIMTLALFTLLGATCAVAAGPFPFIASAVGAGVIFSALVLFLPRHKVLRRMRFAHAVAREVTRRRGNMGTKTPLRVVDLGRTSAG